MSLKCGQCGESAYRTRFMPTLKLHLGYGAGSCQCADKHLGRALRATSTANPFDIRFDHVKDEFGNHLHVENIRQLSAAEKRLGFQSVVLNADAQNFDDPPQQKPVDFAAIHKWKFSNRERYARSR